MKKINQYTAVLLILLGIFLIIILEIFLIIKVIWDM